MNRPPADMRAAGRAWMDGQMASGDYFALVRQQARADTWRAERKRIRRWWRRRRG